MKPKDIRLIGLIGLILFLVTTLTACGSEQSNSSSQMGYKEMKSMVVDILKSDEGKKAVEEALSTPSSSGSGGGIKMLSSSASSEEIRTAVKDTITAPEYKKEFEKIMTDPQFAGDFAKAINSESKDLHMKLIKDPTYQKAVADIMKSPEMSKMFLDLTKTSDFRKQTMTVMTEAMQNPLFKMEVMELLKSVVQTELQPKVEKEKKDEESDSGGEGEGEGEGEGGEK
jgi:spore germination protein D